VADASTAPAATAPAVLAPGEPAVPTRAALRADFGAHFEAHYQRLVAQLFAITLDARIAHDAVQDAYSRAWRRWDEVARLADPASWVRHVAVRSTISGWRPALERLGLRRPALPVAGGVVDERTRVLLEALYRMPLVERRATVLFHMADMTPHEIAELEGVGPDRIRARLGNANRAVVEALADVLPAVLAVERPAEDQGVYR
jgi:DNA-directed RNA polymerase specialized sigma24 family protein